MVEVLKSNFTEVFKDLEAAIKSADFVALDCEFTGMIYDQSEKPSLFDSATDRYSKLANNIDKFTVAQLGLSAFKYDLDTNTYTAESYNVYLRPRSIGQLDRQFWCQASSLDFLCQHGFDFNKFVYAGVSFLNDEEESDVLEILKNKDSAQFQERDIDESLIQEVCSNVAQWLATAEVGDNYMVHLTHKDELLQYTLRIDIHSCFKEDVWTEVNDTGLKVTKVTYHDRVKLESEQSETMPQTMLEHILGFTKVFRLLVNNRKMVIGHNCLTDLMLIYQKFYKPLPESLTTFKHDITTLLPMIYDTKHIALNIRRKISMPGVLSNTALFALYEKIEELKDSEFRVNRPKVVHAENSIKYKTDGRPHEAGFDAFLAGFVFVHMGHLLANEITEVKKPINKSFYELVRILQPFKHNLNLIRGAVDSVNLVGPDPPSRRPEKLVVKSKTAKDPLQMFQLLEVFSRYGNVDIKLQNSQRQALMAVANHKCAKDIRKAFQKDEDIRIVPYHPLTHSSVYRGVLWLGLAVSSSVIGFIVSSSIQEMGKYSRP